MSAAAREDRLSTRKAAYRTHLCEQIRCQLFPEAEQRASIDLRPCVRAIRVQVYSRVSTCIPFLSVLADFLADELSSVRLSPGSEWPPWGSSDAVFERDLFCQLWDSMRCRYHSATSAAFVKIRARAMVAEFIEGWRLAVVAEWRRSACDLSCVAFWKAAQEVQRRRPHLLWFSTYSVRRLAITDVAPLLSVNELLDKVEELNESVNHSIFVKLDEIYAKYESRRVIGKVWPDSMCISERLECEWLLVDGM